MVHIGLIPDGNRRWCRKNNKGPGSMLLQWLGMLSDIARDAPAARASRWPHLRGITELSLYVCSIDNLKRSDSTMSFIYVFLQEALGVLGSWRRHVAPNSLHINVIGSVHLLPQEVRDLVRNTADAFQCASPAFTLNLAIAYDYEQDIRNHGRGEDPEYDTTRMSQIDVVVRTGGDKRLSGFFPTKTYYAELFFPKKYWPDLTLDDVNHILKRFSKRRRRFGA
jgi:undecaprenyl pyrophosphate synthase